MRARRLAAVVGAAAMSVGWVAAPAAADEVRDAQWHLESLGVSEAHEVSLGAGVMVAVLDSGVDASHPDLAGTVVPGIDLTGRGSDGRDDPAGTGTALAGLIAGRGHGPAAAGGEETTLPPDGVLGIAPYAQILPVVVAGPGSAPAPGTVAAGIDRARRSGADVICLGHSVPDHPEVIRALGSAIVDGAVVVIPAGADSEAFARYAGLGLLSAQPFPDRTERPEESEPGELAVPGPGLLTTGGQGGYFVYDRTGAAGAAGVLAGAAALVLAAHPELPGHQVTHRIVATAEQESLDLAAALTAQVPKTGQDPAGPPVDPAREGLGDRDRPAEPGAGALTGPDGTSEGAPAGTPASVAAFDSDDWRRWLVAAPLVTFVIVLATVSIAAARRSGRQNLLTSASAGNDEY